MRTKISKAAFILTALFLSGCAGILKEKAVQYPLVATPSDAKWIDFVIVSEGKYCIFNGEKYGFIAEDGTEITPCIYDIAYPFSEGLACVCKDGKYGYIDAKGETALSFDYDRATPFAEGLAYFSIGDTYGFMDKTGTQVLSFECDSVSSFQEGLAYFSIDGRYGYIDQEGQIVIEPIFDDAGYFKEGLAKVMKDGRYGIINREGDFIVTPEYDSIVPAGSFIIAQTGEEYTCFDKEGKVLLERSENIYAPADGEYAYFKKAGKEGLIDIEGNILIEPLYDWISLQTPEQNLAIVKAENVYGVVDLRGEVMIPVSYSQITYDSFAGDAEGGMFLLTDADGNMECVDTADFAEKISCDHDSIDWISEDRAVVSLDGLSGIIDRDGNLIEPIEYDTIRFFTNGAVWMKKGRTGWFYNSSGEKIDGSYYYDNILLIGNCYQTEKDGKFGFLNEQGESVISPIYDYISDYEVCGCSSGICISTDYNSDIGDSVIKTGEPETTDLSEVLLQNEITPRLGLYQEFARNGCINVADATVSGHTADQEDLRGYKKMYKLYDLDYSGEPILYFHAEPYKYNNFPESYSGFYAIQDDQLVELITGFECGGSSRGDYACLWYDRETSRVLPGTNGVSGGFAGYAFWSVVFDRKDEEMTSIASFGYITQVISNYSDEELAHAELLYDEEDKPYTKETLAQADKERDSAQQYLVNGVQTTIEEYQQMRDRYQILFCVE